MKTNTAEKNNTGQSMQQAIQTDILVVGGGPAGIMAALAAADDGLNVCLIEGRSFVGGNLTIGLPVLGFLGQKGNRIINGLPQKFIDRLAAKGAASAHNPCPLHVSFTLIDPEEAKTTALEMLDEYGVNLLLYTSFSEVIMDGNKIKGVITESKAGRRVIQAKTVIDCTGDADVAFRAGVPCGQGDDEGRTQPPTLMFSMENVDTEKLRKRLAEDPANYSADIIPAEFFRDNRQFILVGLRERVSQARSEGLALPVERTIIITGLKQNEVWINMTRVSGVDGTDPVSLTQAEFISRQQIGEIVRYLNLYVPGFEKATPGKVAPFIGIRETRRITGKYIMTSDDILSCARFDDAIAVASYPLDIHHPVGGGCTLTWCGDCYDIPYRSLVPVDIENLLVAGRSISSTHEAMSAIRVMSTCMALGEAAGRAAKIAARSNITPGEINITDLRDNLLNNNVFLRS